MLFVVCLYAIVRRSVGWSVGRLGDLKIGGWGIFGDLGGMVHLPDTMVDLSDTLVDLPNTQVDLPDTMVDLPKKKTFLTPW